MKRRIHAVLILMVNDYFVLCIHRGCDGPGADGLDTGDGGDEVDW